MTGLRRFAPVLWLLGSAFALVGERYAGSDVLRFAFDGAGAALAVLVLVLCALDSRRTFGWYALGAAGLLAYAATTREITERLGLVDDGLATWRAIWIVAALLCWWVGTATAVGADWTRSRAAVDVEPRRVRAAAAAMSSFALATAWVFALNYTAGERDRLWEWSARNRPRASQATLDLVAGLREPVELVLFFPPANSVLRRIDPYVRELEGAGPVEVTVIDHALEPARAADLGALENGVLFVVRGDDERRIDLGTDDERAKTRIGSLDRDLQEALLEIGRERRTVHLTVGHGERREYGGDDGVPGLRNAHAILRALNVSTRELPVTDLVAGLPADTRFVAVPGPRQRFLPEEVDSLVRFWRQGGSLLLLLEPDVDHGLGALLAELGIRQMTGTVANARYHLRRDGGPSDRRLLLTNRFGSHPTVSDLSRAARRIGLVLEGAAGLEGVAGAQSRTAALVRPMAGSWLETSGDFEHDRQAEATPVEALAMASVREAKGEDDDDPRAESRAVVIGDVDLLGDDYVYATAGGVMSANAKLLLDAYAWLAREGESAVASVPGDDDPPLQRSRGEAIRWFLGTVFGVPAFVLLVGFLTVRHRRRGGVGAIAESGGVS